jgi:hypothetical protein
MACVATSILTRSVRAEEIPTRLEASNALYLHLFHHEADLDGVKWTKWPPVTTAVPDVVDGRPSVIVSFGDDTADMTLNALEKVEIATVQDEGDLPGEGWLNRR